MLDDYINEQVVPYKILKNSLLINKLSHAYLFETNNYQHGFDMALAFAKYLLCKNNYTNNNVCNGCNQCCMIDNGNYSELKIIDSDGLWIKKEQLDLLQKDFSKKSIDGSKQVYIINNAERLNVQAANSILKFLEEPEHNIIAILVTNNKYSLLDTIISRCQIISLKDNNKDYETKSILEKVATNIFNNKLDIDSFLSDKKNEELLDAVIKFIIYLEKNKLDTLLFTSKLWHSYIKDKDQIYNALTIMILFYKDVLNAKLERSLDIFDIDDNINYVKNNNTSSEICDKISKILTQREKIKYNVNNSLLIDSLIIEMEK